MSSVATFPLRARKRGGCPHTAIREDSPGNERVSRLSSGTSDASETQSKLIRWELLRFHSKLEKSSDEVEDVKDDRPIGPASERSTFWPRV
jgi:hypothetical protein